MVQLEIPGQSMAVARLCGALNSQFHQSSFSFLRTDAVSDADWQQSGHLRRTGRDSAQP